MNVASRLNTSMRNGQTYYEIRRMKWIAKAKEFILQNVQKRRTRNEKRD